MRIRWREFELPSGVTIDESTATSSYARFSVEPFERGFGHSLGNGLRRVLLSSIEGTAITGIRIEGIEHEFKPLEGIIEDVTDVVLNLKGILVSLDCDPPVTLSIRARGVGEIKAGDFECPTGVTIVNPDHHICSITG